MSVLWEQLRVASAWSLLLVSWLLLVAALASALENAVAPLEWRVLLDAGLGLYGLLGSGVASIAVLLASRATIGSRPRSFLLFKWTQLASLLFLVPSLVATVTFLMSLS